MDIFFGYLKKEIESASRGVGAGGGGDERVYYRTIII